MSIARGYNGTISFDGRAVTIARTGVVARVTQGSSEKVIPLTHVSAVQWKPAKRGFRGYLELTLAGAIEAKSRPSGLSSQNMDNENAVVFSRRHQDDIQVVRDEIQAALVGS